MRYNQLTQERFIEDCKKIHGNEYDYSKVDYKNCMKKVKIICLKHGIFEQSPQSHLYNKSGCPKCAGKLKTTESFITESIEIHKDKYDYSLTQYINNITKVKIICKKHGIFEQSPNRHLCGAGCPVCVGKFKTTEYFIQESIEKHGSKYDYSLSNYVGAKKKIKIICPKHGFFYQVPTNHLNGKGCPTCKESKGEQKIRLFLKKHNIEYIKSKTFDDCKDKYVLPFDFFVPVYNVCIEFDGIQHFEINEFFGGVKSFNIQKKHDEIKNKYCIENNIKIFRIMYNQDVVSSLNFLFNL